MKSKTALFVVLSLCLSVGALTVGNMRSFVGVAHAEVILKDRVKEATATTGTGTLTLSGAIAGYQSFSAVGNGKECFACAYAVDSNGVPTGQWEVFRGTYTASGSTLSRTAVLSSSTGSAIDFAAGTKHVICGLPASMTFAAELVQPVEWKGAVTANNWPPNSDRELRLSIDSATTNVLAIRNSDSTGYSAMTARTHDNFERMAIGWGNEDSYDFFKGTVYWEGWSGTAQAGPAPEMIISQDWNDGDSFKFYRRFRVKVNGDVAIPKYQPVTNPDDALLVDTDNNVSVGTTVATDATNGFFRIPSCAGTPTGAAADGSLVRDSTNHKVYFRSGGSWISLN